LLLALALIAPLGAISTAFADPPQRRHRLADVAGERPPLPQECSMDPFHADYGGLERGARVRLGRHREVDGDAFWADAMDEFVGRVTTVSGARGVDEKGCPVVSVLVDEGEFDWRVRDLEVVGAGATDALSTVELSPGFAGDPRTFEGTIAAEERFATRTAGCPGMGSRAATMRLSLTADFETISFLAHGEQDLVLMVRTPDGETICADDVDELDPVIAGNATRGVYEIWVGGFDEDADGVPFRLGISEKLTVRAADLERMNAEPIARPDAEPPPATEASETGDAETPRTPADVRRRGRR
jgi:hypothetical protein